MTQKKLEILGPYISKHEGPFCTRDGNPVELITRNGRGEYPILGYVGDGSDIYSWTASGSYFQEPLGTRPEDLMNAREVPVAREWYLFFGGIFDTKEEAMQRAGGDFSSIIHVREVLPGEGE